MQNSISYKNKIWIDNSINGSGKFTITKVSSDHSIPNSPVATMSRSVSDVLTNKNIGALAVDIDAEFIKTAIGEDFSNEVLSIIDVNGETMFQTMKAYVIAELQLSYI